MLSTERSAKRSRSNSDCSVSPIKRTRIGGPFPSFPSQERNINKCTDILHIPWEDNFQALSQSSPDPFLQQQQEYFYLVTPQPGQSPQPPSPVFRKSPSQRYTQSSTLRIENSPANDLGKYNAMYDAAAFSCFSSFTGSDCFTELLSSRQVSTSQLGLNHENEGSSGDFENGDTVSEKSHANMYIDDTFEPYYDDPLMRLSRPVAEVQGPQNYAYNRAFLISPRQLGFLGQQPVAVEAKQPSISPQNMAYQTNQTHDVENLLDDQLHSYFHDDQNYLATHAHVSEGRKSIPNNMSAPEPNLASHPVSRRQNGPSRRRPFQNHEDRLKTAQTRLDKACLRCRMQKIRCHADPYDPQGVCLTCQKVTSLKVSNLQCLRYKVTSVRIFKPGQVPGFDWTQRWNDTKLTDISEWQSLETRRILITEGYSSVPLELEVREFVPQEGDMLERHWYIPGGIKKSVKVSCFAIVNVNNAKKAYINYINQGGPEYLEGWLTEKNGLIYDTYRMAIATANDPQSALEEAGLLKLVLRLWVAIRMTTRSTSICGEDTLGMSRDMLDETSPLHGEIPIPPVMGAQIEHILRQGIQSPLRKQVLDKLSKLIQANDPSTWFTRYLCIFILLHNYAMITKHDAAYAKKHIPERMYARPSMVEEYHDGANVLLAHWHYCKKGSRPFGPGSSDAEFFTTSKLNPCQIAFIKSTSHFVQTNEKNWKVLQQNHAYEQDYFFVSQLFDADWHPRNSVIR